MKKPLPGLRGLLTAFVLLCASAGAHAQMSMTAPRVAPTAPTAGAPLNFAIDCNFCGPALTPTQQTTGNIITIVQPISGVVNIPPPLQALNYPIGPLPAGNYIVRYSAVDADRGGTLFGPIDLPFSVTGAPQAVPALGSVAWAVLIMLLLATAALMPARLGPTRIR